MTPFTITGFQLDGVPLDLAGRRDEEDCWVESVKVAGTDYDMSDMLAPSIIERLCELADAHLAAAAVKQNAQNRAELAHDNRRLSYELQRFARNEVMA